MEIYNLNHGWNKLHNVYTFNLNRANILHRINIVAGYYNNVRFLKPSSKQSPQSESVFQFEMLIIYLVNI